jgi:hypothetical protein
MAKKNLFDEFLGIYTKGLNFFARVLGLATAGGGAVHISQGTAGLGHAVAASHPNIPDTGGAFGPRTQISPPGPGAVVRGSTGGPTLGR